MASIAVNIPEEILLEALSRLPYQKRLDLWKKIEVNTNVELKCLRTDCLESITGIISIGKEYNDK